MLKLFDSMSQLDAEQLLVVYQEQNWDENAILTYLREDFFQQKNAFYAIWVEENDYKAAVRFCPYRDGMLLHSLETAPAERRKGYAYKLLIEVFSYLRTTEFKKIYSHIEKRNRASVALHKKCGFDMIADSATYLDGTVTQFSSTFRICL